MRVTIGASIRVMDGLPTVTFTWGQMSFLKAGICFADRISTVSHSYAGEILTPRFGHGMDGLLNARRDDLRAIRNGVDTSTWNPAADTLIARHGGRKRHVINGPFRAYSVSGLPDSAFARIRAHPHVVGIERVGVDSIADVQSLPTNDSMWALDQIDQRGGARNFTFEHYFKGQGATIYVLDTGIRGDHGEFVGRLGAGWGAPGLIPYLDSDGHGTAVAGLAAGFQYGVARAATIVSVRLGATRGANEDDIVAGMQWVVANRAALSVVNYSYAGNSTRIRDAIEWMMANGIPVVKAAGNDFFDACQRPGNTPPSAIVVAAVGRNLVRRDFSNYGSCVDVFAPGEDLLTAGWDGPGESTLFAGTSGAAPIVTGVVATILPQMSAYGEAGSLAPARARNLIALSATQGVVGDLQGSPNLLVNSLHRYVYWTGTNSIITTGAGSISRTWTSRAYGGNGAWTNNQWHVTVLPGGSRQLVGTGTSYTRVFGSQDDYQFRLEFSATSAGDTASNANIIDVTYRPGGTTCFPGRIC